jgi:hypothetical protein
MKNKKKKNGRTSIASSLEREGTGNGTGYAPEAVASSWGLHQTSSPRHPQAISQRSTEMRIHDALSGTTIEHSRVSRRQLCVSGTGLASALVGAHVL